MKILLVEDDAALARELMRSLRQDNFVVDHAGNGEDGQHLGATSLYDAAVLDLGLPKVSGIAVLNAWRAAGVKLPVLILTARDAWSDKVEGFKAGADDFLTKPFRAEELVMRLRVLIRRAAGYADTVVRCGPLSFNTHIGVFELDGLPMRLTALEWRVLSCLALRKGAVVPRTDIFEHVYAGRR